MAIENTDKSLSIERASVVIRIETAVASTLLGLLGFMALLALLGLRISVIELTIVSVILGFSLSAICIFRNKLVMGLSNRVSSVTMLYLNQFGGFAFYFLGCNMIIFIFALLTFNSLAVQLSFLTLSVAFPVAFLTYGILSEKSKTRIIFAQFYVNIDDYSERQQWLRQISKQLKDYLKDGCIKIDEDFFIHTVNMALLKNIEVKNTLEEIKACLTEEKKFCYSTLRRIIPDNAFGVYRHNSLVMQSLKNPAIIKYILAAFILLIVYIISPQQTTDLVTSIFAKFIG